MANQILREEVTFEEISRKWTNKRSQDTVSQSQESSGESEEADSLSLEATSSRHGSSKVSGTKPGQKSKPSKENIDTFREKPGSSQKSRLVATRAHPDDLSKQQRMIEVPQARHRVPATEGASQLVSLRRITPTKPTGMQNRTTTLFDDHNDFQMKPQRQSHNRFDDSAEKGSDGPRHLRSGSKGQPKQSSEASKRKRLRLVSGLATDPLPNDDSTRPLSLGQLALSKSTAAKALHTETPVESSSKRPSNQVGASNTTPAFQQEEMLTLNEIVDSASKKLAWDKRRKTAGSQKSFEGSKSKGLAAVQPIALRNITEFEGDVHPPPVAKAVKEAPSKPLVKKPQSKPTVFIADSGQSKKPEGSSQKQAATSQFSESDKRQESGEQRVQVSEFRSLHLTATNEPAGAIGKQQTQGRNPAFTASAFNSKNGMEFDPALTTRVSGQGQTPGEALQFPPSPRIPIVESVAVPQPQKHLAQPAKAVSPAKVDVDDINRQTRKILDQTRDDSSYNTDVLNTMYKQNIEQKEIPELPLHRIIPIKDKPNLAQRSAPQAIEIISPQASEIGEDKDRPGMEPSQLSPARFGHEESYYLLSAEQRDFYRKTNQELMDYRKRFEEWAQTLSASKSLRQPRSDVDNLFIGFNKALNRADTSKIPPEVIFNHDFGYSLTKILEILNQHKDDIPPRYASLLSNLKNCLDVLDDRVNADLFHSEDLNEKFQIRSNNEIPTLGKRAQKPDLREPQLSHEVLTIPAPAKQEETEFGALVLPGQPVQLSESARRQKSQHMASLIEYIERILIETHQLSEVGRNVHARNSDASPLKGPINEKLQKEALGLLNQAIKRCRGSSQEKQFIAAELEAKVRLTRSKDEEQYKQSIEALATQLQRPDVDEQSILRLANSDIGQFSLYLSALTEPNMFLL